MRVPRIALLTLIAAGPLGCGKGSERARVDFERMRRQQRAASYSASAAFPNGMTMRTPPPGTLSREQFALGEAAATGTRNGRQVTTSPVHLTSDERETGERDFRVYCGVCHGAEGTGGTVVGSNLRPPPPSLLSDSARRLTDGELFAIVSNGRGRMPAYGWAISPRERWAVIAALRSRQEQR